MLTRVHIQGLAVHGSDIEGVAVAASHLHHLLAVRSAVHTRLVHLDAVGFLVGIGRVILLSLNELVVVVERHRLFFVDHAELDVP